MQNIGTYVVITSGLLALLALPSASAAQERLSPKQMEALVAKASTPADHAQLRQHYLEMAVMSTADADAYAAIGKAYRRQAGQPDQETFADAAAQMDRIAKRARDAAATARTLAAYHGRLSTGTTKSEGTAPFTHPAVPMAQVGVMELIVTATTPAEHARLSTQFGAEAARYTAEADRHAAMAAGYRENPNQRRGDAAIHCDRFVQQMRDAATAARELANYHERVAAEGRR